MQTRHKATEGSTLAVVQLASQGKAVLQERTAVIHPVGADEPPILPEGSVVQGASAAPCPRARGAAVRHFGTRAVGGAKRNLIYERHTHARKSPFFKGGTV